MIVINDLQKKRLGVLVKAVLFGILQNYSSRLKPLDNSLFQEHLKGKDYLQMRKLYVA